MNLIIAVKKLFSNFVPPFKIIFLI